MLGFSPIHLTLTHKTFQKHARQTALSHHIHNPDLAGIPAVPQGGQTFQLAEAQGAVEGVGPVIRRIIPLLDGLDLQKAGSPPPGVLIRRLKELSPQAQAVARRAHPHDIELRRLGSGLAQGQKAQILPGTAGRPEGQASAVLHIFRRALRQAEPIRQVRQH